MSDRSPAMVVTALDQPTLSGMSGLVADAQALPFAPASFDVLISHFMLYHVTDKRKALEEFRRVTLRSGWVGIVLTAADNMERIFSVLEASLPGLSLGPRDGASFDVMAAEPLIRAVFQSVVRSDYSFEMEVDDVNSVLSYARSTPVVGAAGPNSDDWAKYEVAITNEIERDGGFRVAKSCSFFVCQGETSDV